MVIVRILGGLGNQMFQYAYAKMLVQKGFNVQLDISGFKNYKLHGGYQLNKYKIDLKQANKAKVLLSKINFFRSLKEKNLRYDESLISLKGNEYVKGYFQTEKYFKEIRNILLEQFTIDFNIEETTKEYITQISEKAVSCSLHIRRGDYVSDKKSNSVHGTCSLEYYKNAISIIKEKYKNVSFFVFSDDISWTKNNLPIKNAFFVDHKCSPHEDLHLMSLCTHNITANSSFSWWGAWLNKNEQKTIIAPKQWYISKENEIVPKNWIKL
ncbi:alpha-1,2-fucosyltransferase [Polaribacter aestuariivivens]|uniref:Alpha-1,2-fucosyltransferase n=1 Tax=Polaribacter aestuariivivens TaxID=2304626 RepID=A0A5S3N2X4_9FLAO|nr:alpha-1,2-fucosyltransferase [Polaribacter aestuariivivens]TMM28794.1 alpha-1,2-fucosyltransferase [Polaribacter aestuariivivens]